MTAIAPAVRVSTGRARTKPAADLGCAWWTVLPLAALMAYGDGFWVMSLREAAGAIERIGTPRSQAWLRESTLFLPVFVIAVLVATSVALAPFRPRAAPHPGGADGRAPGGRRRDARGCGRPGGELGLRLPPPVDPHGGHERDAREACDAACAGRPSTVLDLAAAGACGRRGRRPDAGSPTWCSWGWAVALRGGRMVLGTRREVGSRAEQPDPRPAAAPRRRAGRQRRRPRRGDPRAPGGVAGCRLLLRRAGHRRVRARTGWFLSGSTGSCSAPPLRCRWSHWGSGSSPGRSASRSGPRPGHRRRWDWPTSRAACSSW